MIYFSSLLTHYWYIATYNSRAVSTRLAESIIYEPNQHFNMRSYSANHSIILFAHIQFLFVGLVACPTRNINNGNALNLDNIEASFIIQ